MIGAEKDWREEFGLDRADARLFFAGEFDVAQRGGPASQAHGIRPAFELPALDDALCTDHRVLVYFKKVDRIDAIDVADLHSKFWNRSGASVLVFIWRYEGDVYSALAFSSRKPTVGARFRHSSTGFDIDRGKE